tara:strand:- start:137 stop:355 length:219 start_codon:yes stop_codon:yes gene_type:complete
MTDFYLGLFIGAGFGYLWKEGIRAWELSNSFRDGVRQAHEFTLGAKYQLDTVKLKDNEYMTTIVNKVDHEHN